MKTGRGVAEDRHLHRKKWVRFPFCTRDHSVLFTRTAYINNEKKQHMMMWKTQCYTQICLLLACRGCRFHGFKLIQFFLQEYTQRVDIVLPCYLLKLAELCLNKKKKEVELWPQIRMSCWSRAVIQIDHSTGTL